MAQTRFQLVPGRRLPGAPGHGGVGWRLLGPNNRELGRSAIAYDDAEAALAAVDRVRRVAVEGSAHIVHDVERSQWAWHLEDSGAPVAGSGRGFRHEREARHNLDQFRREAPTAPTSGPARW